MKNKPSLEEVKDYFKNAEIVKSNFTGLTDKITGYFTESCGDWHIEGSLYEVEV